MAGFAGPSCRGELLEHRFATGSFAVLDRRHRRSPGVHLALVRVLVVVHDEFARGEPQIKGDVQRGGPANLDRFSRSDKWSSGV